MGEGSEKGGQKRTEVSCILGTHVPAQKTRMDAGWHKNWVLPTSSQNPGVPTLPPSRTHARTHRGALGWGGGAHSHIAHSPRVTCPSFFFYKFIRARALLTWRADRTPSQKGFIRDPSLTYGAEMMANAGRVGHVKKSGLEDHGGTVEIEKEAKPKVTSVRAFKSCFNIIFATFNFAN